MTGSDGAVVESMAYRRIADLYDVYVTAGFDIPFFLNEARQTRGPVLELMSGTGRVSMPLVEAGVRLTCVDGSPEMLARLNEKLQAQGLVADVRCMDVRELSLPSSYDLIILPFHSFSELTTTADQKAALSRIRQHLTGTGRFICTLHNPTVKLKAIDGQLRLWGKYPLTDPPGTLLLWGLQQPGSDHSVVDGVQIYEEYDGQGILRSKRLMELRYYLHSREGFGQLVEAAGFKVERLYGDYEYSDFADTSSLFMIWVLTASSHG